MPLPTVEEILTWEPERAEEYLSLAEELKEIERVEYFQNISLRDYSKEFWSVREPSTNFQNSWVVGALCEHLTACYERQIQRLLINIYFRSAKSTFVSVFFPSWVWTKKPSERFLCASFAEALAVRDAYHCRQLIESELYQKYYGSIYKINSEQSAKSNFENNLTGVRRSIGTGGQTTGFGGGIKILDDPNDTQKSESPVIRDSTNDWFDKTWTTRSDDFSNDVSIVIQQRTHKQDVSGHIQELGLDYEILKIPLEYAGQKYFTSLGWSDPREIIGEVADPVRFPPKAIKELKTSLNIAYAGQAQQDPVSASGNVIKREWYNPCYTLPISYENNKWIIGKDIEKIQGFVDLAASDQPTADRTAMNVCCKMKDGKIIKLWQYAGRWNPDPRDTEIRNFFLKWNEVFPHFEIQLEATFGMAVKEAGEIRNKMLKVGLNVKLDPTRKSKVERFSGGIDSYRSAAEAQRIEFYQGNLFRNLMLNYGTPEEWIKDFFEESCALYYKETPSGSEFAGGHDDLLDDDVGNYNLLTRHVAPEFNITIINDIQDEWEE